MQPEVMVLDEPTSFLDPLGAQKIFEVVSELNRKLGVTVILVEHRLDLASKHANHVIIMDERTIVLDDEPQEVFDSESARLIGVGIPKATKLWVMLRQNGVRLGRAPVNPEEAVQLLRGVLQRDRS